ncbi:MAG: TolC family protein [Gemmatimonadota bacterium]
MKTYRMLVAGLLVFGAVVPAPVEAQEQVIDIGVLVDQPPADLANLFQQMAAEIVAVVGNSATIRADPANVRSNGYDPALAEAMYQEMVDGDIDVILAFGPVTASVVSGRPGYEKPTVLFGGVNRDLMDLPEGGATSGISNFTYIISDESYVRDVQTLRSLYSFDRLGVIMPPGLSEAFGFEGLVRPLMASLDVDFEIIDYSGLGAVDDALDRVDAIYLLESLFIPNAEIEALAQLLIDRGVPSFSGARRDDVEMGLMATNQPRQGLESFFRRIALTVESVANGEDLADRTVFFEASPTLTVNFHTARAVGVPIRYSSVATTEFVGAFENPLAEQTYSLIDLIDEALASNLGLESRRSDVRLAEQEVRSAWSNYLPSVGATVTQSVLDTDLAAASQGQNPQYSTDGTLSVTQAVFSPDANAGIAIQRELAGAQSENLRAVEWDVVLDAAGAYFRSLILKANLEIQARNTDATKSNLRIARQSFAAGQTGRGDVLRLESEAARDMQALVDAVNALEQSFHAINELVNRPVDREIDVADISMEGGAFSDERFEEMRQILDDPSLSEPFEDFLASEAITNAPELRIFDYNIGAVGRSARLNGLERFLPTVAAGLDLNRSINRGGVGAPPAGTGLDQYFTLGISASIPLFDSNQRRIARQTSLLQQDQLRVDREGAALAIERAVRDIVLDLTTEIANIQLSAISESAAEEGLSLAQDAYASGAITLIELLDSQTNFLSAQLARASARYNFLATSVGLQRLVGHFSLLSSDELNDAYMDRFRAFVASQGGPS